nr:MAG TPA: hypothetical protein [Caudoviricetes sp.]
MQNKEKLRKCILSFTFPYTISLKYVNIHIYPKGMINSFYVNLTNAFYIFDSTTNKGGFFVIST